MWKDPKSTIDADAKFIGPVWVGAGRHVTAGTTVIGPSIVWDDPQARPATEDIKWLMIEPRDIPEETSVKQSTSFEVVFKRIFDIAFSICSLGTLWIYPFIMYAIWKEDGRPFFFSHKRETKGGVEFGCIKFRSMRKNAEEMKRSFGLQNQADGPQFYIERDPRLTRVGYHLRKYNLDELPQFFNSTDGPDVRSSARGQGPHRENQFTARHAREARLSVRPGITGLWQIHRTQAAREPIFRSGSSTTSNIVETRCWCGGARSLWIHLEDR